MNRGADAGMDGAMDAFAARTGLVFPGGRRSDFLAGAARAMSRRGIRDAAALADRLGEDGALVDELVTELAVHESYFFREPAQFEAIREVVLPRLRAERAPEAPLRVWSAGCARGEEVYSLAILLEEMGLLARCSIHGGDISRAALADAAKARYSPWAFRGTAVGLDPRYFRQRGAEFHLLPRVRDRVTFHVANLAAGPIPRFGPGPHGLDLILCRNVLIYFDVETVRTVAGRLYEALNEGGWLVTAPADPPLWDFAPFELHRTPGGIFYRKPPAAARVNAPQPRRTAGAQAAVPASSAPSGRAINRRVARPDRKVAEAQGGEAGAWLDRIKAAANLEGSELAERRAAAAVALRPTDAGLRYLHAVLLLDLRRSDEAVEELRRTLYLDRRLVPAHLLLGAALRAAGRPEAARRAYANALRLCAQHQADDVAALADGETFGRLAEAAAAELAAIAAPAGRNRAT